MSSGVNELKTLEGPSSVRKLCSPLPPTMAESPLSCRAATANPTACRPAELHRGRPGEAACTPVRGQRRGAGSSHPACGGRALGGTSQLWGSPRRSEGSQPLAGLPSPGLRSWKEKSPQCLAVENCKDGVSVTWRADGDPGVLFRARGQTRQ